MTTTTATKDSNIRISTIIPLSMHKQIKLFAILKNKTMQQVILEAFNSFLECEKRKNQRVEDKAGMTKFEV
jgi:hypothetical protein